MNIKVDKILTPSWLSGLIAIAAGLIVTVGVIITFNFKDTIAQQRLTIWQNTSSPALTLPGESPPGTTTNSLQNTWPLIGFWIIVGLLVYLIVEAGMKAVNDVNELKEELDYVHARRDVLIRESAVALLIRLLAMLVWLFFIEVFFKRIIPYSITASHDSVGNLKHLDALRDVGLSFLIIAASIHVHTFFLRVALHRSRVFSNT
jgi:phosphotransferase system  glucose/maltose/N-acetylglucosamine-specific IIC component